MKSSFFLEWRSVRPCRLCSHDLACTTNFYTVAQTAGLLFFHLFFFYLTFSVWDQFTEPKKTLGGQFILLFFPSVFRTSILPPLQVVLGSGDTLLLESDRIMVNCVCEPLWTRRVYYVSSCRALILFDGEKKTINQNRNTKLSPYFKYPY